MTATLGHDSTADLPAARRLTVGEMQAALAAARAKLPGGPTAPGTPVTHEPSPAPTGPTGTAPATDVAAPWLPDHDGPVTLTTAMPPRRASGNRRAEPATVPARPPTQPLDRAGAKRRSSKAVAAARAELARAPRRRLVVIPACGGSGATTVSSLLAAALAPVADTLLVAGEDQGALAHRCGAEGGDLAALAAWAAGEPTGQLSMWTPGLGVADLGDGPLLVAAPSRCIEHTRTEPGDAVLAAARAATGSVVFDTAGIGREFTRRAIQAATTVLVTAPRTVPGLLAVEFCLASIRKQAPSIPAAVAAIDVFARAPSRGVRAAMTRLSALRVSVARIPFDRSLASGGAVRWHALRPRTQAAACALLTQFIHREGDSS